MKKTKITVANDVYYFAPWYKRLVWWLKLKMHRFLLWCLNITNNHHYDFGEPITGMFAYKGKLVVSTEHNLYVSKDGKTFENLKRQ